MNIQKCEFPNYGYLLADIPKNVLFEIASEIDEIKSNPLKYKNYSDYLVADIKESYELVKCFQTVNDTMLKLVEEYDKQFPGYLVTQDFVSKNSPIGLSQLWVNLQSPGEINPNHSHFGIFSFVIWMYVPYNIDELQKDSVGAPVKGSFEFTYTQTNGQINHITLPADKSWHGKCCFFPSTMQHCVYPYTHESKDAKRITVSGNIKYII